MLIYWAQIEIQSTNSTFNNDLWAFDGRISNTLTAKMSIPGLALVYGQSFGWWFRNPNGFLNVRSVSDRQ